MCRVSRFKMVEILLMNNAATAMRWVLMLFSGLWQCGFWELLLVQGLGFSTPVRCEEGDRRASGSVMSPVPLAGSPLRWPHEGVQERAVAPIGGWQGGRGTFVTPMGLQGPRMGS